jgi:hypothetical protein
MREGKNHLGLQSKNSVGGEREIGNIIKKWVAIITKILISEWQLKHLKNQLKQHRVNV